MQINRAATRAGAAGLLLAPLLAAGCSGEVLDHPDAAVTITPAHASGAVKPDTPITIAAKNGKLHNVTVVEKGGGPVEGVLALDGGSWQSRWPLDPARQYEVTATAFGTDGQTQTASSAFSTTKPKKVTAGQVLFPENKETVGVGMPIKIHFEKKVTNKAAVEKALEVRSSNPVEGAWRWFSDTDVVFRTKDYWPAHTKVQLIGHTAGVQFAKGVYGNKNIDLNFKVGDRIEAIGSAKKHQVVVKKNGKKIRTMPVSMGMGGAYKYLTTSGNHLAMEKEYMTIMTSPGIGPGSPGYYRQNVYYTVRISDSGEYLHSAPWSVGSQGNSNVSHGCVNMSPSNARWYHGITHRGDPIKITGTARPLDAENGWGFWQLNWKSWLDKSKAKATPTSQMTGGLHPAPQEQAAAPSTVIKAPGGPSARRKPTD